jgi:hypothetical protein
VQHAEGGEHPRSIVPSTGGQLNQQTHPSPNVNLVANGDDSFSPGIHSIVDSCIHPYFACPAEMHASTWNHTDSVDASITWRPLQDSIVMVAHARSLKGLSTSFHYLGTALQKSKVPLRHLWL